MILPPHRLIGDSWEVARRTGRTSPYGRSTETACFLSERGRNDMVWVNPKSRGARFRNLWVSGPFQKTTAG